MKAKTFKDSKTDKLQPDSSGNKKIQITIKVCNVKKWQKQNYHTFLILKKRYLDGK